MAAAWVAHWRQVLRMSSETREVWQLIFLSALIGVVGGYGAIAFYWAMGWLTSVLTVGLAGFVPPGTGLRMIQADGQVVAGPTRPWIWFFLPALGAFAGGCLVYRFAPEAEGHGTDAVIDAYHHREGFIRARVPFVKGIASAMTIGSGGSAGAEGPIVQVGAGLASIVARVCKLTPARSRILMAAGIAAGVGAVFRAPTAAALFAAEVLYRDMDIEFEVIIPCVVSAVMGYAVFVLHMGTAVLFATEGLAFHGLRELPPYLLMGGVMAIGAYCFVKVFYGVRDGFARLRLPNIVKPAIGGLLVGCIGLLMPEVLGQSYGLVQRVLVQGSPLETWVPNVSLGFLLAVFALKTLATAFSIGSGGSGGIFGPSLVAGAALGGACGLVAQRLFPDLPIQVGAFALVGMAGFFAAAANTPISTIIMVSELTGSFALLIPSMWVSVFAYVLARRYSIYEHQLKNRLEAPIHQGRMVTAMLRNATVAAALEMQSPAPARTVGVDARLSELRHVFAHSTLTSVPVVDSDGRLAGMVVEARLRTALNPVDPVASARGEGVAGALSRLLKQLPGRLGTGRDLRAADLMTTALVVGPDDTLFDVLHIMAAHQVEEVTVVDPAPSRRIRAVLTNADITRLYHAMLADPPAKSMADAG